LPLAQFGSWKLAAGMMQRWPRIQGSRKVTLATSSSDRALFVL